ncbi:MAG: hypothetical protein R3E09_11320 [Novosphingobium sp.]
MVIRRAHGWRSRSTCDLFLRTLLLTGAMSTLRRGGAQQGLAGSLAANGILFQLFMLSTLILDGFENAAQVLCGEARGARSRPGRSVRRCAPSCCGDGWM